VLKVRMTVGTEELEIDGDVRLDDVLPMISQWIEIATPNQRLQQRIDTVTHRIANVRRELVSAVEACDNS
jgi:hypothetical protein